MIVFSRVAKWYLISQLAKPKFFTLEEESMEGGLGCLKDSCKGQKLIIKELYSDQWIFKKFQDPKGK